MVHYNSELDEYESYYHPPGDHENGYYEPSDVRKQIERTQLDRIGGGSSDRVLPPVGHALSGAASAALSNLVTYPFETISTRRKVQRLALAQRAERTRKRKGKRRTSISSSSDDEVRGILNVSAKDEKRYRKYASERDGSTRVVETWEYEYDEEELYTGIWDAAQKIYHNEGVSGFYHGLWWDTLGSVTGGLAYFVVYNMLRRQRMTILGPTYKGSNLPIMEELGIGIAAAAASKFITSPISNVVTRKQTSALLYPNAKSPSIADIYHDIMREKGVVGLWSGYSASLWLTLNPSLTFLFYETAKPLAIEQRGHLDRLDTFFLVALCKAAATTLTYPMTILRVRSEMEEGEDEMEMHEMYEAPMEKGIHVERGREKSRRGTDARYQRNLRRTRGHVELLTDIIRREGFGALYIGIRGALLKGFITQGVTMGIKEAVHRYVIQLYFYVLEAYNETRYGTIHETAHRLEEDAYDKSSHRGRKLIEKTEAGARKVGRAAGRATLAVESAKDTVEHPGEKFREKAHIGHHSHSRHGRSFQGQFEEQDEFEDTEDRRLGSTARARSDDELFEERVGRTTIREERFSPQDKGARLDRSSRERSFHEERTNDSRIRNNHAHISRERQEHTRTAPEGRLAVRKPAPTPNPSTGVVVSGSLVGTPPLPASKTIEKVASWRSRVAEETAAAAKAAAITANPQHQRHHHSHHHHADDGGQDQVRTTHEHFRGKHGEHVDRTTSIRESHINRLNDPSIASGQSYRSDLGSGRTSMFVHPPSVVRDRIVTPKEGAYDWAEESRRVRIGGGDVGVNGDVRARSWRNGEGAGWK